MKILYIATSFPEPSKGATIYTDLAEALHKAGHEITVAVSEQPRNKKHTEMKNERGFEVLRIVTGNYYDVGYIEKGLTTLKIPILMRTGIRKYLGNRKFDLVLFESPPVTNSGIVTWSKKQFNCMSYLMLKDIFPQNAADLGILKPRGVLFHFFKAQEKKLYKAADCIGCMSQANRQYLINENIWLDPNKIELFPNTKKLSDIVESVDRSIRREFGIPDNSCVFLFGGNMGRPQYMELLCRAVKALKSEPGCFFLFIGRGTDRFKLENTIRENHIPNAMVLENLPRADYEQITRESDVGLIVLDPRFSIPNFPSRILSYMEYGKPVLAATDRVSDIKDLIEAAKCGEWVWSGDEEAFINRIRSLAAEPGRSVKGMNGRKYIKEHFTVERSVSILEDAWQKIQRRV
ncbi:MAG: glycosyltransferase family 4 protein [Eubacteriaceae bacterium]|nr:glycosyltransferase family 4 protein [Eubacteriaceae bacterium]